MGIRESFWVELRREKGKYSRKMGDGIFEAIQARVFGKGWNFRLLQRSCVYWFFKMPRERERRNRTKEIFRPPARGACFSENKAYIRSGSRFRQRYELFRTEREREFRRNCLFYSFCLYMHAAMNCFNYRSCGGLRKSFLRSIWVWNIFGCIFAYKRRSEIYNNNVYFLLLRRCGVFAREYNASARRGTMNFFYFSKH